MDSSIDIALSVLKKPSILAKKKHIFLLSHMRANTSLIGHILGDHPQVSGYYEMHNGYYSWKSLLRQKAIYTEAHPTEKLGDFMFDKILHNGHEVDDNVLLSTDCLPLVCIRAPIESVKSAIAQFRKKRPSHEFTNVGPVIQYYLNRLDRLAEYAKKLPNGYFYYDAEAIKSNTNFLLSELTHYLKLDSLLKAKFKSKNLTGKGKGGDHSGNLLKGEIVKTESNYDEIDLTNQQVDVLTTHYETVRKMLISNAKISILKTT